MMNFVVKNLNGVITRFKTVEEVARFMEENIPSDEVDAYIDSCYERGGTIHIYQGEYYVSEILAAIDPVAYDCCCDDTIWEMICDLKGVLNEMQAGEVVDWHSFEIRSENYDE